MFVFILIAHRRWEPGKSSWAGWSETRLIHINKVSKLVFGVLKCTDLLLYGVFTLEFDFKPKGHLEIGESLDIIRQRLNSFLCNLILIVPFISFSFPPFFSQTASPRVRAQVILLERGRCQTSACPAKFCFGSSSETGVYVFMHFYLCLFVKCTNA